MYICRYIYVYIHICAYVFCACVCACWVYVLRLTATWAHEVVAALPEMSYWIWQHLSGGIQTMSCEFEDSGEV